jgi:hypothetical protein
MLCCEEMKHVEDIVQHLEVIAWGALEVTAVREDLLSNLGQCNGMTNSEPLASGGMVDDTRCPEQSDRVSQKMVR